MPQLVENTALTDFNNTFSYILNNLNIKINQIEAARTNVYDADIYYWSELSGRALQILRDYSELYTILLQRYQNLEYTSVILSHMDINTLYNMIHNDIAIIGSMITGDISLMEFGILNDIKTTVDGYQRSLKGTELLIESMLIQHSEKLQADMNINLLLTEQTINDNVKIIGTNINNRVNEGILFITDTTKAFAGEIKDNLTAIAKNIPEMIKDTAEDIAERIWIYFRDFVWEQT